MELSPKEREALANYSIEALKALTELFKASTELVKLETELAKEAVAEAKEQKDRKSRMH